MRGRAARENSGDPTTLPLVPRAGPGPERPQRSGAGGVCWLFHICWNKILWPRDKCRLKLQMTEQMSCPMRYQLLGRAFDLFVPLLCICKDVKFDWALVCAHNGAHQHYSRMIKSTGQKAKQRTKWAKVCATRIEIVQDPPKIHRKMSLALQLGSEMASVNQKGFQFLLCMI